MLRSHHRVLLALTGIVALSVAAAGCSRAVPEVLSPWPVANAERVVPEPPAPPVWPFTGMDAPSSKAASKRPLSIKIENSSSSRPQIGLNSADVVYEVIAEGGITRFNCIFHSTVPKTVGPVRSARLADLWIVPQYGGLFFFSGSSSSVRSKIRSAGLPNLSQDAGVAAPYWRATDRRAPHNLMLDTEKAYREAAKRKIKTTAKLKPLTFVKRGDEPTSTVKRIDIPFSQANRVRWDYDAKSGKYLRWNNGAVHVDRQSGKQVRADNVVVMWAKYSVASRDKVGSATYSIGLGGKGRATVFRNGARLDVTWTADRTTPPRFRDADGNPVRLARGTTWFQVIPLDGRVDMK